MVTGNRNRYQDIRDIRVSSRVVRHRVLGIKDSSKTVVRKSDSGRQEYLFRQPWLLYKVNLSLKEPESREITYCSRDYPTLHLLQRSVLLYKGTFSKSHCPSPARSTR